MATTSPHGLDPEKTAVPGGDIERTGEHPIDPIDEVKSDAESSTELKQHGVKKIEAVTTVWSMKMLCLVFALLYLVSFVDSLLGSVQGNLVAYVTSDFQQHGLLATTSIVSTILGGAITPTIAKIIDIRDRTEGFLYMVLLITIGMIMKATCQNVETYAAAQTFYWVGHLGLQYIISIILADMTSLRNRMIMFAVNGTPLIASTFAGPKIAELFYENLNFRWAFGAFTIILVGCCIPVAAILYLSERKAKKFGLFPEKVKTRSVWESAKYYFIQFDVVGLLLLTAGWSLFLLPFNLVQNQLEGWQSATVICLIVFGLAALAAFVAWEKFLAPVQLFPYKFLKDRTILGGSLAYGVMFISIYCWDTYYYSYLQVAHYQDIASAGYILNTFSLTAAIISPWIGLLIHFSGTFKWVTVIAGIPFTLLGTALLVYFRTPGTSIGYLVMCQFFNGFGSAFISTCGQLAVMAAVNHQEVAMALALFSLFGSIGAAIGIAISGSIWTNLLRNEIFDYLPEGSKDLTDSIYADIVMQMSYPAGDPIREAIILAYGDVQRKMVIAGSAFVPLILGAVLLWKNINVKPIKQTTGNVF